MEAEVERRTTRISQNYTKEISALKEQLLSQEAERRNEIYTYVIIGCVAIYFFFYTERQRSNQVLQSLKQKLDQQSEIQDNLNASLLDIPSSSKLSKKKIQKEIKRAKSMYQIKRAPLEAPM
jgi:hypothetical protein